MNIRCFAINLEKDIDKKKHLEDNVILPGINVEILPAVYGKDLKASYISEVYSAELSAKNFGRSLVRGEIGCVLSHLSVYKKMIKEDIDYALVIEDDVDGKINLTEINYIIKCLPSDFGLVLLGHHPKYSRQRDTAIKKLKSYKPYNGYSISNFAEIPAGSYAYIISKAYARKRLDEFSVISKPIDEWVLEDNVYGIYPAIFRIHENYTTNSELDIERSSIYIYRNSYSRVKDKIRLCLEKINLLEKIFIIKGKIKSILP